jgi:AmmeMemoRadiSam system protein A
MDPYINLAKKAINAFIKNKKVIEPPADLPKEITEKKAGAFVCIKKNGDLRGCIGTFLPTKNNLAEEIISNAISSATCDSRFCPIGHGELDGLKVSVDILSKPEQVDSLEKLNPKKYGILVQTDDGRSGLLLPDLEGVDTVEEQISIACQKGNIDLNIDKIYLFRFTVERHEE